MSVLIKGMKMPASCHDCIFFAECFCPVLPTEHYWTSREGIHPDCPLVPVPPHGRLIDKDALLEDIDSNHIVTPSDDGNLVEVYGAEKILAHIAYAPTVIEAGEGDAQ